MELTDVVAGVVFAGIVAYALFGGADFGSGIWDLTAGDAQAGGDKRRLIDQAIGPLWEANHVWLIFVLVFLLAGFPDAFTPLVSTLSVPLSFAVLGIVVRGAAFAFRKVSGSVGEARIYGALFAVSSLITPFFLGTVAGAVASGRVPSDGTGARWSSWTGPTSIVGGALAVLTCAFLAATLLAAEADGIDRPDLADWFGTRALWLALITGGAALAGIWPLADDAPTLFDGLTGRALPAIVISAVGGTTTLWLLYRRRWSHARYSAAVAVTAVVAGWGVAQYPWLLVDQLKIADAAGADATLWGLLITFAIAALLVLPALGYLLWLANNQTLSDEIAER